MKILVSVKYFLVFWIVKHIQLNHNIQNPVGQMNKLHQINQIIENSENPVSQIGENSENPVSHTT